MVTCDDNALDTSVLVELTSNWEISFHKFQLSQKRRSIGHYASAYILGECCCAVMRYVTAVWQWQRKAVQIRVHNLPLTNQTLYLILTLTLPLNSTHMSIELYKYRMSPTYPEKFIRDNVVACAVFTTFRRHCQVAMHMSRCNGATTTTTNAVNCRHDVAMSHDDFRWNPVAVCWLVLHLQGRMARNVVSGYKIQWFTRKRFDI